MSRDFGKEAAVKLTSDISMTASPRMIQKSMSMSSDSLKMDKFSHDHLNPKGKTLDKLPLYTFEVFFKTDLDRKFLHI